MSIKTRILLVAMLAVSLGLWTQEVYAADDATVPATQPELTEPTQAETTEVAADEDRELTRGEAFLRKLEQGGLTMVFLAACSVFGLGFTIERLVGLRRGVIVPAGLAEKADKLWRAGKYDEVRDLPRIKPCTLSRMLAAVTRHRHSNMSDVSMIAGDIASRELINHMRRAYPLAIVATLSPMLGLLGTIIGMIGAFDKIAMAGSLGDASLLGADIGKALITTGAGLSIAVPALALYHYFRSRINLYGITLEEEASDLIANWYLETDAPKEGKEVSPTSATGETSHAD